MGGQAAITYMVDRAIAALRSGSEQDFSRAVKMLKLVRFNTRTDEIVYVYEKSSDSMQRERLAQAYRTITGRDIEERLQQLRD